MIIATNREKYGKRQLDYWQYLEKQNYPYTIIGMNPAQQNNLFAVALGAVGAGYLVYKQPWMKPTNDQVADTPVSNMTKPEDTEKLKEGNGLEESQKKLGDVDMPATSEKVNY